MVACDGAHDSVGKCYKMRLKGLLEAILHKDLSTDGTINEFLFEKMTDQRS